MEIDVTNIRSVDDVRRAADRYHAQRYPDGCRAKWSEMCEACCQRLGERPTVVPGVTGATVDSL